MDKDMKSEEIVRALQCISNPRMTRLCNGCKYRKSNGCDADEVNNDANRLIEPLCADKTELRRELEWKDMVIALAQRKQAKAAAERDALREKVPQWISVEDRLPDYAVPVLVSYIGLDKKLYVDGVAALVDSGWLWWEGDLADCEEYVGVQITHWMPLPAAPEEKKHESE